MKTKFCLIQNKYKGICLGLSQAKQALRGMGSCNGQVGSIGSIGSISSIVSISSIGSIGFIGSILFTVLYFALTLLLL